VPGIAVVELVIDDDNTEKFWQHGQNPEDVVEVLFFPRVVRRNRKERRASHILIGRTRQGWCLAMPIEPTAEVGVWRPVTAWRCKPSEWALLP
jgi:hypothetical protein